MYAYIIQRLLLFFSDVINEMYNSAGSNVTQEKNILARRAFLPRLYTIEKNLLGYMFSKHILKRMKNVSCFRTQAELTFSLDE